MRNWIDSEALPEDIVLSSRVRLARNFEDLLFTDKMELEDAINYVDKVYEILSRNMEEEELELVKLYEMDYKSSKFYVERGLISEDLLKRRDRSAFVINRDETISVMINEEDHLRIQSIADGLNIKEAYIESNKIDDFIEGEIPYSFHEEYGYLTARPTNMGTGIKASVIIHLPAITMSEEIQNISKGLNQVGMNIRAMYGERIKACGNIYQVSNQITLGVNEEEIISNLEGVVFNIINEEKKSREILMTKYKYEIEDKIFRSYGILKNAIILTYNEILDLSSNLRLGVEMSLLKVDKKVLNRLLVDTRDSVIQSKSEKVLSDNEKNIERAKLVKDILGQG
ncbi:protein arginine kinase [Clostridium sp. LP20]|uniref:protein arginine kinase n=1 Tax=Clostridium sp. LP20 TaxID=3418665 RepID=UPI003EE4269C